MSAAVQTRTPLSRPLAGRRIVVTRPAGQAGHLTELIGTAGGQAVLFPVLAIADVADARPLEAVAARLEEYDLAVFVSANAVERALASILARRSWPRATRVATVGGGSERALVRLGFERVIAPRLRFDSEALLELAELQDMRDKRVLIFRGEGGRELLGETLSARGASVDYVSCYRRERPAGDAGALLALWERGELDALTVTSSEGLHNLWAMLEGAGRGFLAKTPLFAPHSRIAAEAGRLGLERVIATPPGDEGLIAGLIAHFSAEEHGS